MKPLKKIAKVAPDHFNYWKTINSTNYKGEPFSDRSGVMIIFSCKDCKDTEKLVLKDPFITKELLEHYWIKEWQPE